METATVARVLLLGNPMKGATAVRAQFKGTLGIRKGWAKVRQFLPVITVTRRETSVLVSLERAVTKWATDSGSLWGDAVTGCVVVV